jgi:hypothetical protein
VAGTVAGGSGSGWVAPDSLVPGVVSGAHLEIAFGEPGVVTAIFFILSQFDGKFVAF